MSKRTRFVSADRFYADRRRLLRIHRPDVANRLRVLRSRGIKVRSVWKGCCWVVLSAPNEYGIRQHVSTINARIDGVFVDDSPSRAAKEYAEQVVSMD